jgi:hypothetical protein
MPFETRELHEPRLLVLRFREAVAAGVIHDTDLWRVRFFGLARYVRRYRARNPIGLFTAFLNGSYLERAKEPGPWWDRLDIEEENWGREANRQVFGMIGSESGGCKPTERVETPQRSESKANESDFETNRANQQRALARWAKVRGAAK